MKVENFITVCLQQILFGNIGIEDPTLSSQLTADEKLAEDLMEKYTHYDPVEKCWQTCKQKKRDIFIDEKVTC